MTRFATAALLGLTVALAGLTRADEKEKDKPKDKEPEKGLKELEGTYKVIAAERDGKLAEKGLIETVNVVFKGDEFTLSRSPDDKMVAKIKVTPDAKLSTIDFAPQDGEFKGKTLPGIYKFEKNELIIVYSEKGDRPKEFKSDDAILMRLKKAEK